MSSQGRELPQQVSWLPTEKIGLIAALLLVSSHDNSQAPTKLRHVCIELGTYAWSLYGLQGLPFVLQNTLDMHQSKEISFVRQHTRAPQNFLDNDACLECPVLQYCSPKKVITTCCACGTLFLAVHDGVTLILPSTQQLSGDVFQWDSDWLKC